MAGGGYPTGTAENPNATGGVGGGNVFSDTTAPVTPVAPADYYSTLTQPWSARYLASNPDVADAMAQGKYNGTAAQHYQMFGQNEGRRVGSTSAAQALTQNIPSYYNTNPVGVDYANIFNPAARSVTTAQQALTPQQQANYLNAWQQDYSQLNRAATQAANQQRINTANAQWANYLNNKAKAEAAATGQGVVDKAVEEALAQQQSYNNNDSYNYYNGKSGGQIGIRGIK